MEIQTTTTSDEKLIRTAYGPKLQISMSFPVGEDKTKQSFKAESDINNIMAQYLKTGLLDYVQRNEPRYGDTTGFDYQSAMFKIAGAKTMFNELPAELRARFDNEPANFLDFVQDDSNREEAIELGLLKPEVVQAAVAAKAAIAARGADHTVEAPHEPLRDAQGQYREHTRAELRAEAKATKAAKPSEPPAE